MLRRSFLAFLVLFTLGLAGAPLSAQIHKDERLGFSIRTPTKWSQIPIGSGEQWVCARFDSDRKYAWTDDTIGYTRNHKPTLRVIGFVDAFINRGTKGPEKGEEEEALEDDDDEEDEGSSTGRLFLTQVYRNYDEFLKKNFHGGYYIAEDSEGTHGKIAIRKLNMRAEEAGENGHRLILTWIYTTEIGKIAVEFEVLESAYGKLKNQIDRTFKSFKVIPRTKELTINNSFGDFFSLANISNLSPEERMRRKKEFEDRAWEKVKEGATDGWEPMEIKGLRVITRHDKKHASSVVEHVLAVSSWLEKNFPGVGPEEYVRQPIIRICKNWEEESSFRRSSSFDFTQSEIVTHKDTSGATGYEWGWIHRVVMNNWFRERDRTLSSAMPTWLDIGMERVLTAATVKGKKLKFGANWWERGFRDGQEPWDLEKVMTTPRRSMDLRETEGRANRAWVQCTALVRFVVDGPGSKGKFKGFMGSYMENVSDVIHEIEKKEQAKGRKSRPKATTEEEEDALLKARKKLFEKREAEILKEAYRRTTEAMKPSTLEALKKAYAKTLK